MRGQSVSRRGPVYQSPGARVCLKDRLVMPCHPSCDPSVMALEVKECKSTYILKFKWGENTCPKSLTSTAKIPKAARFFEMEAAFMAFGSFQEARQETVNVCVWGR